MDKDRTLKILIVHNSYKMYGGEDSVVKLESDLLRNRGNTVITQSVSNDEISGFFASLRAAVGTIFSLSRYLQIRHILRVEVPDVVHVHNFFPLFSPSVFYACRASGVPTVLTLHNFRIICPTAMLMHEGAVTERSVTGGPWWALRHRVYRGSLIGTFLLCLMISLHKCGGTWHKTVDRFIVLSQFARLRFAQAGLPVEALVVKPNFVDIPEPGSFKRAGLLFVGRLSSEKGIDVLLAAADRLIDRDILKAHLIAVAGAGPLDHKLANSAVLNLGALPSEAVKQHMQSASALLLPSIWYEGFPMVLVEAFANGLPVIASRIGALAELVEDGVTGLLFEPGDADDLSAKMAWALEHPEEMRRMGVTARGRYESLYTPQRNYEQLMTIYHEAIQAGRNAT